MEQNFCQYSYQNCFLWWSQHVLPYLTQNFLDSYKIRFRNSLLSQHSYVKCMSLKHKAVYIQLVDDIVCEVHVRHVHWKTTAQGCINCNVTVTKKVNLTVTLLLQYSKYVTCKVHLWYVHWKTSTQECINCNVTVRLLLQCNKYVTCRVHLSICSHRGTRILNYNEVSSTGRVIAYNYHRILFDGAIFTMFFSI